MLVYNKYNTCVYMITTDKTAYHYRMVTYQ